MGVTDCWIGLNDLETDESFRWLENGSTPSYTNWYGANPAVSTVQNCVKKKASQDGTWDDVGCFKTLNYACSMAAVNSCEESNMSTTSPTSTATIS